MAREMIADKQHARAARAASQVGVCGHLYALAVHAEHGARKGASVLACNFIGIQVNAIRDAGAQIDEIL